MRRVLTFLLAFVGTVCLYLLALDELSVVSPMWARTILGLSSFAVYVALNVVALVVIFPKNKAGKRRVVAS